MKRIIMTIMCAVFTSTSFAYYNSEQGRWMSRDPINENGGENIYCLVVNAPIQFFDPLGQSAYIGSGPYYRHWLWGGGEDMDNDFSSWDPGFGASDFSGFDGSQVCGSNTDIQVSRGSRHRGGCWTN